MEVSNEKIIEIHNELLQMSIASQKYAEAVENLLLQIQPYMSEIHNERMFKSRKKIQDLEKEMK